MKKVSKQHVVLEIPLNDLVKLLKATGWISEDEEVVSIESIKYKDGSSIFPTSLMPKPSKLVIKYKSSKVLAEDKVRYELPEGSVVKPPPTQAPGIGRQLKGTP